MKLLSLPDNTPRRLVFYLAMEEYAARHLGTHVLAGLQGGLFFTWQTVPTVIFGRNQVLEAEVNTAYCRDHGVEMYRRKSGGGCVYSDGGNIMLSYITPIGGAPQGEPTSDSHIHSQNQRYKENRRTAVTQGVAFIFDKFLNLLSLALRRLGLDAQRSGRNDILIRGRKVSGNAFYLLPGAGIVHGTLLFDSDLDAMTQAITPSKSKIESKGVASVRQHVTNLKTELEAIGRPMSMEAFRKYLNDFFTSGEGQSGASGRELGKCPAERRESEEGDRAIILTENQIKEIETIEKSYLDPAFISGRKHGYTIKREGRLPGVGEMRVELAMEGTRICGCSISGDYFPLREGVEEELSERLDGCRNEIEAAAQALKGIILQNYIMNLDTEAFLNLAFREGE